MSKYLRFLKNKIPTTIQNAIQNTFQNLQSITSSYNPFNYIKAKLFEPINITNKKILPEIKLDEDKAIDLLNKYGRERKTIDVSNLTKHIWKEIYELEKELEQNPTNQREHYLKREIALKHVSINEIESIEEVEPRMTYKELDEILSHIKNKYIGDFLISYRKPFTNIQITEKIKIPLSQENLQTINKSYTPSLRDALVTSILGQNVATTGVDSGVSVDTPIIEILSWNFKKITHTENKQTRKENGFFAYLNKTDINLEQFQIYSNEQTEHKTLHEDDSCILYALKQANTTDDLIRSVMIALQDITIHIPLTKMQSIAEICKKHIILHIYDETAKKIRIYRYNKESTDEVNLAQYRNHIFNLIDTKYTNFYLNNKEALDDKFGNDDQKYNIISIKDNYFKKEYKGHLAKRLNSLLLIVKMMELNMFEQYSTLNNRVSNNFDATPNLNNIENEQRPFFNIFKHNEKKEKEKKEKEEEEKKKEEEKEEKENGKKKKEKTPKTNVIIKEKEKPLYLYGDLESDVVTSKYHKLIAFGMADDTEYYQTVYPAENGQNDRDLQFKYQISNMFKKCMRANKVEYGAKTKQSRDVIMFFHNLKYDAAVLNEFDQFYCSNTVQKDGQVYAKTYYFDFGLKVELRDSYKHFGGKLTDAPTTFGLKGFKKLEAINYTYHTINNISCNEQILCSQYTIGLKPSDKEIFNNQNKGLTFNPTEYYLEYLKQDVIVLRESMKKYRELIKLVTYNKESEKSIDAYEKLTISSIAHAMATEHGCYDDLYETNGSLREYIQKSIRGGRCFVNPKFQNTIIEDIVEDFDAVQMYLTSMSNIKLPTGKIHKAHDNITYNELEKYVHYVCQITITKINKAVQVPCVSYKDTTGSVKYVNELDKPLTTIVDKRTLNDYIQFQDIEYEIIDAIYWNETTNDKLSKMVLKLYHARMEYKKDNEPLANMIKLVGNSIYGKTCMSRSNTTTVFISRAKENDYIFNHFGTIASIHQNKFNSMITKRAFDSSYGLNFVGSMILSQSKYSINKVFDVMNDEKMDVFYTDTDSIHMRQRDVTNLEKAYQEKYSENVVGEEIGQYHVDFKLKDCVKVVSICHIPIRQKVYLDILEGVNKYTQEIQQDVHMRMKGVNKAALDQNINNRMQSQNISMIQAAKDLYTDLSQGKEIKMCLNPTDFDVRFVIDNNGVQTRATNTFIRNIKSSNCVVENNKNSTGSETSNITEKNKWKFL